MVVGSQGGRSPALARALVHWELPKVGTESARGQVMGCRVNCFSCPAVPLLPSTPRGLLVDGVCEFQWPRVPGTLHTRG